jgi:hypothetical protein
MKINLIIIRSITGEIIIYFEIRLKGLIVYGIKIVDFFNELKNNCALLGIDTIFSQTISLN